MGDGYSLKNEIKFNFDSINLDVKDFSANSPPSVFVGRFGYPSVNVGILSPIEMKPDVEMYDSPRKWAKEELGIKQIISLRSNLINSRFKSEVKNPSGKFSDISKEIAMAYKPVDIEVNLKNKPINKTKVDSILTPLGKNANLEKIKLTSNPKIKTKVEKTVSDGDLKAVDAINNLYKKGIDENTLSKILSVGSFGIKKSRRLVPTRWSITATDDTLGKRYIEDIKQYDFVENSIFCGNYLGNFFIVMFFPDVWGFELFEMEYPLKINPWSKNGYAYATDFEDFEGRKKYAAETSGGYYASRLPIVEKLSKLRKQGAVLAIRIITEEDEFPLGVWVVREAMRKSMENKEVILEDNDSTINLGAKILKDNFNIDMDIISKVSNLLGRIKTQSRLSNWY